jgi:hypothetical protein
MLRKKQKVLFLGSIQQSYYIHKVNKDDPVILTKGERDDYIR